MFEQRNSFRSCQTFDDDDDVLCKQSYFDLNFPMGNNQVIKLFYENNCSLGNG